jgi:hypothetical protein
LCDVVGEDLHFVGTEPAMVAVLNKKEFQREYLDEASYVALADYVGNGIHARIQSELLRKFGPAAAPRQLPTLAETPHPHDMVAYAYLWKHLEFANEFEQLDKPLRFKGKRVGCFGIGEEKKESHAGMLPHRGSVIAADTCSNSHPVPNSKGSSRAFVRPHDAKRSRAQFAART